MAKQGTFNFHYLKLAVHINPNLLTIFFVCLTSLINTGCRRQPEIVFVKSSEVAQLPPQIQHAVVKAVQFECGTPATPKMLGNSEVTTEHLLRGQAIFEKRCASCHGSTGDGNGPVAASMYPRPRDYRRGVFKFTSTRNNERPLKSDLIRTVKRGASGTSMPSFSLLGEQELNEVVDYVLVLTHRGELEQYLAQSAEDNVSPLIKEEGGDPDAPEEKRALKLSDDFLQATKATILTVWADANDRIVRPLSTEIPYSIESAALGKKAFLTEQAGCFKCHGADGKGAFASSGPQSQFKDSWGFETRAADLTSGMLHGGNQSIDIYRRIVAGISGTPMPAHESLFVNQPDTLWHVVHYIQFISSARRREVLNDSVFNTRKKVTDSSTGNKPGIEKTIELKN